MNLKNRLNKLENQVPKNSNECECFDKHHEALINKAYGEPFNKADILPDNAPIEGICIKCKKLIPERIKNMCETLVKCYGGEEII